MSTIPYTYKHRLKNFAVSPTLKSKSYFPGSRMLTKIVLLYHQKPLKFNKLILATYIFLMIAPLIFVGHTLADIRPREPEKN